MQRRRGKRWGSGGRCARLTGGVVPMLARRGVWLHERGLLEVPRRISSAANVWADVGSRPELGGVGAVRDMAREMGLAFRELRVPDEWRDTGGLLMAEPVWG